MSEEKTNNLKQTVSSVGNAWIVTESKSHPGHVYYFNTLTGEAVWNLSDGEIQKARLRTQNMASKPTMCPEPKTNPPTLQPASKKQYNNRFCENQQTNMCQQTGINIFQTQQLPRSVYSDMSVKNIPAYDFNAVNSQLNAFNVISTPTAYNSHGWSIPRTQQFILTPTIPLVNQAEASLNMAYNQILNSNQPPVTRNCSQEGQGRFQRRNKRYRNKSNFNKGNHSNFKKRQAANTNDLRQRLLSRTITSSRSYNTQPCTSNECENKHDEDVGDVQTNTYNINTKVENHNSEFQEEGTLSQIDIPTALKNMAESDTKSEGWYIVVDINILLEEFKFLQNIIESDEHCKLMVPGNVMTELKEFIASTNNIPARLIFHCLSQLFESGTAFVGGTTHQDYGFILKNPILETCFGLIEENYHVILLTDNSELLRFKKFFKINMFTMSEIKSIFEENHHQHNDGSDSNSKLFTRKPLLQKNSFFDMAVPRKTAATMTDESILTEEITESDKQENGKAHEVVSARCTNDAAIQTEPIINENQKDLHNDLSHSKCLVEKSQNSEVAETPNKTCVTANSNSNCTGKRREIKLKRNISTRPSTKQNNERKVFRWRRSRNIPNGNKRTLEPSTHSEDVTKNDSACSPLDSNQLHTAVEQTQLSRDKDVTDTTLESGDTVESRESSVICLNMKKGNLITIEESSTSGIISNSDSNIESEYKVHKEQYDGDSYNDVLEQIVAYEIDNENMEESLRTKHEEWISRFMQTMEEVLSVILQEKLMFKDKALPPPWTLHEAVQCIRKNSNSAAVRFATDKLSSILFELSDESGKIMNMTPCQYMMMYSYGVSLLNVIKANICDCEDIQIAQDSLQRLLNDIKNPYCGSEADFQDISTNFNETHSVIDDVDGGLQEKELASPVKERYTRRLRSSTNNTENTIKSDCEAAQIIEDSPQKNPDSSPNKEETHSIKKRVDGKLKKKELVRPVKERYKLRSSIKNTDNESEILPQPVELRPNTERQSSFFLNINLKKITRQVRNTMEACKEDFNNSPYVTFSKGTDKEILNEKSKVQPKVVRKFLIRPEFEEKLQNKAYTEYESRNFGEENRSDIYVPHDLDEANEPNAPQPYELLDYTTCDIVTNRPDAVDPSLSNYIFKFMMNMCLKEIRDAFNEVKDLCNTCYEELEKPQLELKERKGLINRVENAESHIVDLCISLQSMLDGDPNTPRNNVQNALKKAGVDVSYIDEPLLTQYRDTIHNSKEQAGVFLISIREIIEDLKILP